MSSENATSGTPVEPIVMLPCPFCGGDVKWIEHDGDFCHGGGVLCNDSACVLGGELIDGFGNDQLLAANKWNQRDWNGMTTQFAANGFLQGVLQGLRIGIDDERARIIDSALSDERYFAT